MTTRIVVSIPYIHPGDEVVIQTFDSANPLVTQEDIVRLIGVKEYTIWGGKNIAIYERHKTDENSNN